MKRLLFVVTREAVYRHEILGIFVDENYARMVANFLATQERDSHHTIRVSSAPESEIIEDVKEITEFRKREGDLT